MAEVGNLAEENSREISEIGDREFSALIDTLKDREDNHYNSVGWSGNSSNLETEKKNGSLCPASAFAVVAEGLARYKRTEPQLQEDTNSLRNLAQVLDEGSTIYTKAIEIDATRIEQQIKTYIESHGGVFESNVDWAALIEERSTKLVAKANLIDEVNS